MAIHDEMQLRNQQRNGLTLLEMVLVLTLLVIVFSVVAPRLVGPVSSQRLKYAADEVRTAWGKARNKAMRSGEPHQFLYVPESRAYLVTRKPATTTNQNANAEGDMYAQVVSGLLDIGFAVEEDEFRLIADQLTSQGIRVERLPPAITFLDAATAASLNPMATPQSGVLDADNSGVSSVTFFPDGTSSTTMVWLTNESDEALPIALRGMTGMATVGGMQTVAGGGRMP